jgi:hypothetical protein
VPYVDAMQASMYLPPFRGKEAVVAEMLLNAFVSETVPPSPGTEVIDA